MNCVNLCELWCTAAMITVENYKIFVWPDPLSLLCGAGNLAKFGRHAGNMKFNTQSEDSIRLRMNLLVYFSIHHVY
jgi:hypothetical protein